jgi:hypothetical protein
MVVASISQASGVPEELADVDGQHVHEGLAQGGIVAGLLEQ